MLKMTQLIKQIYGFFDVDQKIANKYPKFTQYLKNDIQELANNKNIMNGLMKYGGFTENEIKSKVLKFGEGSIKLGLLDNTGIYIGSYGYYPGGKGYPIMINEKLISQFENAENNYEQSLYLLLALSTILHETVHYGEWENNGYSSKYQYEFITHGGFPYQTKEAGEAFEIDVFWKGNAQYFKGENNDYNKFGREGLKTAELIKNISFESLPESTQDVINQWLKDNPNIDVYVY